LIEAQNDCKGYGRRVTVSDRSVGGSYTAQISQVFLLLLLLRSSRVGKEFMFLLLPLRSGRVRKDSGVGAAAATAEIWKKPEVGISIFHCIRKSGKIVWLKTMEDLGSQSQLSKGIVIFEFCGEDTEIFCV
jgi:hypothetical protein